VFDPSSRYAKLDDATYTDSSGNQIRYKRRRFLPDPNMPLLSQLPIQDGERLDNFTARTLGNPEHYWRICDANNTMNPIDLESRPDQQLKVPVPQF
jgi:hypothetical protein